MRRFTTAAVALTTLIGLFGCASTSENAESGAAPTTPAITAGLDQGTHNACVLSGQATLNEAGRDLDVATAKDIISAGKASESTLITSAVNVLESAALRAEAAAGTPDEGAILAEVSAAILKVQTVCRDIDALKASIETRGAGGGGEAGTESDESAVGDRQN
ncbi:hypothetical protein [Actinoplanes aureus]|uniref:Uncharacterized protein n=1 Tax=Actinoplanes aureus TaxID=2792083 RepID=A0A931G1J3_9ACTN|nr:hypothetical protein [Actinoplanes aureus]MBG0562394.1 hypothetical protein [Actinoplanes aureus]